MGGIKGTIRETISRIIVFIMLLELLVLLVGLIAYRHYNRRKDLPPGPFSIPFFGNLFNLPNGVNPGSIVHESFYKYGDMYTLFIGYSNITVVINNLQLVKDLFSKDEFSGRMKSWFHEKQSISTCSLGFCWLQSRDSLLSKISHQGLSQKK